MVFTMRSRTTVILADDHSIIRAGIRTLLEQQDGIVVVAEAGDGREAVALAAKHAPDIMLIDIGMQELNGIEASRRIHAADPLIGIIALSMHTDERYVTGMFDAGARGFLIKTCEAHELLMAIDTVRVGRSYITPTLTHVLVNRRNGGANSQASDDGVGTPPPDVLTPKEREVLQLIAEGITTKEISVRLGVAIKTAETHRTNLMRKLNLHSIAALTRYAIREGISTLSD